MSTETKTVRLSEAKKYIQHHFKKKSPVMVWGPPGIGKSEIVESIVNDYIARGKRAMLVDVRLPLWEPTDIKGIPYFDSNTGTMVWAPPAELPSEEMAKDYDIIVLFLDELNGAAPAVQAAAYQLILNRRVGAYKLPDNVVIVAAGNRESDKGVTYRMPKPLSNRFAGHFEIRVNFDDWVEWATNNAVSSQVVGYLTAKKADLNRFDPKSSDRSFPTPRSWTFVSNLLEDLEDFNEDEISDMIIGAIGEGTALGFIAHRKTVGLLPDPRLILKGQVKDLKTKTISALFSLATSLAYELRDQRQEVGRSITEDEYQKYIDNTIGFWMEHFEPEMVVMSFRLIIKYGIKVDMKKISNWKVFYERYGNLVRKA